LSSALREERSAKMVEEKMKKGADEDEREW
jgi:hypothetical protein